MYVVVVVSFYVTTAVVSSSGPLKEARRSKPIRLVTSYARAPPKRSLSMHLRSSSVTMLDFECLCPKTSKHNKEGVNKGGDAFA